MTVKTIPLPDDVKPMLEAYASFGRSRLAYVGMWFSVWAAGLGGVLGFIVYRIFRPCLCCSLRPEPEYWPVGAAVALALAAPILFVVARSLPDMWAWRRNRALAARADLARGTAEAFEIEIGEHFRLVQPGEDVPSETLDALLIIAPLDTKRTVVLSLDSLPSHDPHELDNATARNWRGIVIPHLRFLWGVESSGAALPRISLFRDDEFTVLDVLDDPGAEHVCGWVIAKPFDEVAAAIDQAIASVQVHTANV